MGTAERFIKYRSACKVTNFLWNDCVSLAFFHEYCIFNLTPKLNN